MKATIMLRYENGPHEGLIKKLKEHKYKNSSPDVYRPPTPQNCINVDVQDKSKKGIPCLLEYMLTIADSTSAEEIDVNAKDVTNQQISNLYNDLSNAVGACRPYRLEAIEVSPYFFEINESEDLVKQVKKIQNQSKSILEAFCELAVRGFKVEEDNQEYVFRTEDALIRYHTNPSDNHYLTLYTNGLTIGLSEALSSLSVVKNPKNYLRLYFTKHHEGPSDEESVSTTPLISSHLPSRSHH